tara:strand:- start:2303 stop:2950 length:648 start_codon:yes stop_codon:yes gene_type:complete
MNGNITLVEKEKEPNIYIKAMELGYRANDGISYVNMKELLEGVFSIKFSRAREYTFLIWFLENFKNETFDRVIDSELRYFVSDYANNKNTPRLINLKSQLSSKFYINGYTVKQYIDYLELTEARQQAQKSQIASEKALVKAKQSIWIAAGGLLISVGISLYMHLTSPTPPFDVNILQDHTTPNTPEVIQTIPENIPEIDSIKVDAPSQTKKRVQN